MSKITYEKISPEEYARKEREGLLERDVQYWLTNGFIWCNGIKIGDEEETDPTVPTWAKQPTKPTYEAEEVGAVGEEDTISNAEIDAIISAIFG